MRLLAARSSRHTATACRHRPNRISGLNCYPSGTLRRCLLVAQTAANIAAIDSFVGKINLLSLDATVAQSFGETKALLRRQGQLIEDFDLAIAMTARVYDITLVTNNERHFRRVPGVQLSNCDSQ